MNTFNSLAAKYGDKIDNTHIAESFFKEFMEETEGNVNVDFIDGNNFDRISKVDFYHTDGLLKIFFYIPEDDEGIREMRKMVFPFDTYSMSIKLDKIRFVRSGDTIVGFYIQGVTDNVKSIKKFFRGSLGNTDYAEHKTEFFSSELIKLESGLLEDSIAIDTPIISCWVISKDFSINSTESRKILYELNIKRLLGRLSRCKDNLQRKNDSASCKEERQELFESTGNTLRILLETLLKLKLNHHYTLVAHNKDSYHTLLVGDLVNILLRSNLISQAERNSLQRFTQKANELSHASGIPAEVTELETMIAQLENWIAEFKTVTDKIGTIDFSASPSDADRNPPGKFIDENLFNWNFSDEIRRTVRTPNNKCLFRIKRQKDFADVFDCFERRGVYLGYDGYFYKDTAEKSLNVFSREEVLELREVIIDKSVANGYDAPTWMDINLNIELEKNETPSHLFTLDEITELMRNADDSKSNQLVIDEDGYPHLIHEQGMGSLYPVSQETWCANNWYVGKNSSLSDAEPSYHLCLEGWLFYLTTGKGFYSDLYPKIDVESTIAEIMCMTSNTATE